MKTVSGNISDSMVNNIHETIVDITSMKFRDQCSRIFNRSEFMINRIWAFIDQEMEPIEQRKQRNR